jgi:hypothetical protein
MMSTTIPFSGFYETIHHDRIEMNHEDERGNVSEEEYAKINWREEEKEYAQAYAKEFSKLIGIPLEFEEMTSPREYNFMTDRIFCKILEEDVEKLKREVGHIALRELVRKRFTSHDGFMSFYSNDYEDWLKQKEPLDHNQIGTPKHLTAMSSRAVTSVLSVEHSGSIKYEPISVRPKRVRGFTQRE